MTVVLVNCSSVHISDQTWYADKGILGAVELHTQTDVVNDIPKASWDAMRFGDLCITPDTFAEIKKETEQLCSVNKCTYDMKSSVDHIMIYLNHIESMYNKALSY